jgi:preprotein translocase subunit Sec63
MNYWAKRRSFQIFGQNLIGIAGIQYSVAQSITAETLKEAAGILGIQERASLHEIRIRYHEQIKEVHPDVSQKDPAVSHERTIRLKEAYDLLVDYCMNHAFSFRVEDLAEDLEQSPADYWTERFGHDPIWG